MKTAENIRREIIKKFFGADARLGTDYIDWHGENGECGLTINIDGEAFGIVISKKENGGSENG